MRKLTPLLFTVLTLLFSPVLWAESATEKAAPAEELSLTAYQFAVYLLPDCGKTPATKAAELATTLLPDFKLVASFGERPQTPVLLIKVFDNAQQDYTPPDEQFITYFGRGLSTQQAKDLLKSNQAIVLSFAYPSDYLLSGMKQALAYTKQLADTCKGLIWDDATREIFTPEAWHTTRISSWDEASPDISRQITIHAYKNTDFVRAITLGMEKFSLPDIVVNDFSWSDSTQMSLLINLIAQSFVEGNIFDDDLNLSLNIHDINNTRIKNGTLESLLDNANPKVKIPLKVAKHEEGDPDNFLLEINFEKEPGKTLQEKQAAFVSRLFGSKSTVLHVKHNEAIYAASDEAKRKLPQLAKDFNKGLAPGEFIYVKAPFAQRDGGNEWMWVEVIAWKGKKIRGLLQNEPRYVPNLKIGAEVIIDQADVFDYIRNFADGSIEGNKTGALIEQYNK